MNRHYVVSTSMQAGFAFSRFADRLATIVELSSEDLNLLCQMPTSIMQCSSHEIVVRIGEHRDDCSLLLQGYLCWRTSEAKDAQIISVHVPGDIPDLHGIHAMSHGLHLSALGSAVIARIPHRFFHMISASSSSISQALSILMATDVAALRNRIVNLGDRDALTRAAHLICEIAVRLRAVGLARDLRFSFPFTQTDLASACGISPVHANRVIQELRRKDLLRWDSRMITITDWNALVRTAGFREDYLMLRTPQVRAEIACQ